MSSSNSPCAACKLLRRKCLRCKQCFKATQRTKCRPSRRCVNSLAYEAEARLRDPVYGCVGLISILQQRLKQVQNDLFTAKKELSAYIGPSAMLPIPQPAGCLPQQHMSNPCSSSQIPYNTPPMLGLPTGPTHGRQLVIREPHQTQQYQHQQQILEAQQIAEAVAAREQQEMLRTYEQQRQQQQLLVRFNSGFDAGGTVGASSFNQMTAAISPSLALGPFDNSYQLEEQQQELHRPQMLLSTQTQPQQQQPQLPQQQQVGVCTDQSVRF
ncbi:LOB domain-containing protein 36 [Vitis vinifera]|uniref:LOB domain-containing protein 36 n=1 Tax=Vitis vinifera TaxID=29760 RepID=A0A438KQU5_VITVI|nr:LOB domain-containing protein 36 [Vitis vinifera]